MNALARLFRPLPVARLLAVAHMLVPLLSIAAGTSPPALLLKLPLDLIVIVAMRRRRWRFPAAVWLSVSGFAQFGSAALTRSGGVMLLVAAALGALAAAALLWPRHDAADERAPLAPLPLSWGLLSALLVAIADFAIIRALGEASEEGILRSCFASLALFIPLSLASRTGPLRWVLQLGAGAFAAFAASFEAPDPTRAEIALQAIGALAFALGFDWLRAAPTARERFARTALSVLAVSLLPPLLAAPHQVLAPLPLGLAAARALAFGLALGLAPRVSGIATRRVRPRAWFGLPRPWPVWLAALAPVVVIGGVALSDEGAEVLPGILIGGAVALLLACIRARAIPAFLGYAAGAPLAFGAAVAPVVDHVGDFRAVLVLGATAAVWAVAAFATSRSVRGHFLRRLRIPARPAPVASVLLAGASAAAAAAVVAWHVQAEPETLPLLVSRVGGPFALRAGPFVPGAEARPEETPPSATGSAVAVDPLGRGVWYVDEERDVVALMPEKGKPRRFYPGAWPEQIVAAQDGRVYVSARQAGRVHAIDPDFTERGAAVGVEPRALALDEKRNRLYAGLVTEKALVSLDAHTLEPIARIELGVEPRAVAITPQGVAVLPGRGSAVLFVSPDLSTLREVPLYTSGRRAWHGQALVPAGRDLIVVHAGVDTGLSQPTPSGGYGGGVREPVETLVAVLHDGRPSVYPEKRDISRRIDASDVTGAAMVGERLVLASRGTNAIVNCRIAGTRVDECHTMTMAGIAGIARAQGDDGWALAAFERELMRMRVSGEGIEPLDERSIGPGRLDAEMKLGRALFHGAGVERVSASGMSCATCHPDGREDGLVWRLQGERRQTPMLAARLKETAPYNWQGTTATLEENIKQTIERLGGSGLEEREVKALARYIRDGLRAPAVPMPRDEGLVAEGRQIFNDTRTGCNGCHMSDAAFTGGGAHDVGLTSAKELQEMRAVQAEAKPLEFDTPSLLYAALTAPYFHDGSAKTLEEAVERAGDRMGHTSHLSRDEKRALAAYLASLGASGGALAAHQVRE